MKLYYYEKATLVTNQNNDISLWSETGQLFKSPDKAFDDLREDISVISRHAEEAPQITGFDMSIITGWKPCKFYARSYQDLNNILDSIARTSGKNNLQMIEYNQTSKGSNHTNYITKIIYKLNMQNVTAEGGQL